MEPRIVDQSGGAEAAPRYADLAQRLLSEHAELFRLSPLAVSPAPPAWRPRRAAAVRRRSPQLTLPLRPHVLDGGDRGTRP